MEEDEGTQIPLQDQRVFGAGISKKRINFVRPETTSSSLTTDSTKNSVGDQYLSLVMEENHRKSLNRASEETATELTEATSQSHLVVVSPEKDSEKILCKICRLPMDATRKSPAPSQRPHEASLVHQVCLSHSHPPSNLDRTRRGFKYLSSHGWDPDSRLGLGASGTGIRIPIKAKLKNDTVGLGVEMNNHRRKSPAKLQKLDAKKVRQNEQEARRKKEKLQEMFYRNDDVEKYLT